MDDDLRSLMSRRDDDDDLFGAFTDPDDLNFDTPFEERAGGLDDFDFSDPFAVPTYDEPTIASPAAPPPAAATVRTTAARRTQSTPSKRPSRKRAKRGALGMTAQQRMVLAIFLFLDVAVLGLLILLAIGAISF